MHTHERTANLEVLREVVAPVQAQHRLAHRGVFRLALKTHVHFRAGIDDALVKNRHAAHRIIHRVVGALNQVHTAGGHFHRTLRYVHRTQVDLAARRGFQLTGERELVLLRHLLSHHLR